MNEALAKEVIERSREAAIKEGVAVCITVVDESGLLAAPGGPIYTLEATNGGLISFGGGVMIKDQNGKVIGSVYQELA